MSTNVTVTAPQVPVVVQRVVRQLVQTFGPVILTVLTAPGATSDVAATVLALGWNIVQTALKTLLGWKTGPGSPWYLVVLDRAGTAAAGVVIGTGVSSLAGLMTLDWAHVLWAAAIAAVTSLVMLGYVPPVEPDPAPAPFTPDPSVGTDPGPATSAQGGLFDDTQRRGDLPY